MRRRRRRAQGGKDRGAGKPGWERSPYEAWPAEVDSSVWRAWSGSIMRAGSRSRGLDATRGRPLDMSVRTGSQPYIGSRSWSLAGMSERMQHRSTRFQGVLPAFASQPCEDAASENGGVVTAALGSREFCASQPLPRRVPLAHPPTGCHGNSLPRSRRHGSSLPRSRSQPHPHPCKVRHRLPDVRH